MEQNENRLGRWQVDEDHLPVFDYYGEDALRYKNGNGHLLDIPAEPWFLLGNYRMTMFVHTNGRYQFLTGERTWARINYDEQKLGANGAEISVDGKTVILAGDQARAEQRRFGTGYAEFIYAPNKDVRVKRVLAVKPSEKNNQGIPAFLAEIQMENNGTEPVAVKYMEWIGIRYQPMGQNQCEVCYRNWFEQREGLALVSIEAEQMTASFRTGDREESRWDYFPPSVYIQTDKMRITWQQDRVELKKEFRLEPGQTVNLEYIIGVSYTPGYEEIMKECRMLMEVPKGDKIKYRREWRQALSEVPSGESEEMYQEMLWNCYNLEAMATYREYYGETFIPQGMTYDYQYGRPCAARDHLQHALPIMYTNPELAKSCIRYVLKKMTADGELKYMEYGYGKTSNGGWSVSDQQLYLFYTVAEYLRVTGDYDFLAETTAYYPPHASYMGSTLDKLKDAMIYLIEEVGTGARGLVRLLNSDWNDMVYHNYPMLPYYGSAESNMNTTMVLKVFPDLLVQLDKASLYFSGRFSECLTELKIVMKRYLSEIETAFYQDLGDRNFPIRLYLKHDTCIGRNTMHLEAQIFLLQAESFSIDKKKILYQEIKRRLCDNEILGARQSEAAVKGEFEVGQGENGGFWYSLNGPLILGIAKFDKMEAWKCLRNMGFRHFAETFPEYYVGQWTGPDCFFSSISSSPYLPSTPCPLYCAHAHAWPLYCYMRLTEEEEGV